ncbi:hypothetical protein, partial [Methylobacterium frigidaeris]|uniref:hypothetical protein n=1 Tax=Methylobacterium frigidaeris TaxID=2038277 RepID=UPI001A9C5F20
CRCEGDRRISAGARSGLPGTFERVRSKVRRYKMLTVKALPLPLVGEELGMGVVQEGTVSL